MRNMSEDVLLQDLRLDDLRLDDLRAYVEETGWKDMQYPGDRLLVFEGPENDDGRPIILSLPAKRGFRDTNDRLFDAINLLAAVEQTSPSIIIQKIHSRNLDIMRLRLPISSNTSPSVETISSIVHGWRNLIAYSACMEEEKRSYFAKPLSIGKQQAEQFGFGHTFRGSFGLTIESRIPEPAQEGQVLPLERRVIERITRGLLFVRDAEQKDSSKIISDNFMYGLNANMCRALLEVIQGIQKAELEYTVTWSPRWKPSSDIQQPGSIFLRKSNLSYVEEAERVLKGYKIQIVANEESIPLLEGSIIIQGLITNMNSDDPNHLKITVKWHDGQRITIPVGLEDYQFALDAHKAGHLISVSGKLKSFRRSWILEDPHDLKVV